MRYTIRLDHRVAIARGRRAFASAGNKRLVLRRSPGATRLIRPDSRQRLVLQVAFVDHSGTRRSVRRGVTA